MSKPEVLQLGAYAGQDQARLEAAYTAHRLYEAQDPTAFLAEVGPKIRAIATRGDKGADAATIAGCPNLEVIAVYGVGYDAVDLEACRAQGVAVTNTPDVLTDDVADLAVAMLLAQARGVVPADGWARSGNWATQGGMPLTRRVSGKRVGILGLGRIGFAIARRLEAFGMQIAYSARAQKDSAKGWAYIPDPVALAEHSDFLVVALAASAATRHIVNAAVLAALGPEGTLVNISRAANVDELALLDALEGGTLGAAALDVFEGEPQINPRFAALPNVLLQPHIGSATVETRQAMGQLVLDNLAAHFAGKPLLTPVTL